MTHRSKSTLFLIEQLIVIAVFAICAVACISILTSAYFTANDSKATSNAILVAESGAEVFKATGGDADAAAYILRGSPGIVGTSATFVTVFYDSSWQVCGEAGASYFMHIVADTVTRSQDFSLIQGELSVRKITGEELVAFPIAARG